jgi:hypothetical protein
VLAKRKLSEEQRQRISFYPFGLAADDDVIPFYKSLSTGIESLASSPTACYGEVPHIYAPVVRMQTMHFIASLPKVDVLKLDIEGAEWKVFHPYNHAMHEWLSTSPPSQICIEFHDRLSPELENGSRISRKLRRPVVRCFVGTGSHRCITPPATRRCSLSTGTASG